VDEFYANRTTADGYSNTCKACQRMMQKVSYHRRKGSNKICRDLTFEEPKFLPEGYVRCENEYCHRVYPREQEMIDLRTGWCKRCMEILVRRRPEVETALEAAQTDTLLDDYRPPGLSSVEAFN